MTKEKRYSVMVKFTKEEFDFLISYQKLKLGNCLKLNPPAIKLTNGDTVRLIIQEFCKLTRSK